MKKTTEQVTLTESEISYVYTCWMQAYTGAYKDFRDYLKVVINVKRSTGSVYK